MCFTDLFFFFCLSSSLSNVCYFSPVSASSRACGRVINNMGSVLRQPGFQCQLYHLPAVWPWGTRSTFLCLICHLLSKSLPFAVEGNPLCECFEDQVHWHIKFLERGWVQCDISLPSEPSVWGSHSATIGNAHLSLLFLYVVVLQFSPALYGVTPKSSQPHIFETSLCL